MPDQKSIDKTASWVTIISSPIILAVVGWALLRIMDHDTRLAVLESEEVPATRAEIVREFRYYDEQFQEIKAKQSSHSERIAELERLIYRQN